MTSDPPQRERIPAVVYVLAAGTFLMGTSEFVVAGLLHEVAASFDVSVAQAGLTITVFAVGMVFGAPVMAIATARIPARVTLSVALLVFAAGHVLSVSTNTFAVMLAGRIITAVATGAFWAVASVAAARIVGQAAAPRALGLVLGGGMLANVLGVPLGSFAGLYVGWRGTFSALALLSIATAIITFARVPSSHPDALPTASVRAEIRALRSPPLWLTLALCTFMNFGVLSIYSFIGPLLTDVAGFSPAVVPPALLLFGGAALLGSLLGGRVGEFRPLTTVAGAACLTLITASAMWALASQPLPILLLFAVLGFAGTAANPVLVALAIRFGGDAPVLAGALPTSFFNIGTAAGTALTASLIDAGLGSVTPTGVATAAGALLLVPLVSLVLQQQRTRHNLGSGDPTRPDDIRT